MAAGRAAGTAGWWALCCCRRQINRRMSGRRARAAQAPRGKHTGILLRTASCRQGAADKAVTAGLAGVWGVRGGGTGPAPALVVSAADAAAAGVIVATALQGGPGGATVAPISGQARRMPRLVLGPGPDGGAHGVVQMSETRVVSDAG
jgi:mRNA-degrading endonuclease toxin of MazEF toxin-antitoxin module